MDRIAAMTAFVRVVEAGTFTKAADTLNLPNATVTRLIQSLEEDLKIRLLHRTTRSVTVTPEGAAYYERVVALLADLADIESTAKQSVASPSGRVRVETAAGLAALVIVPALGEFYRNNPQVQIELGAANRQADLVAEGVDCAIRVGEVTDQFLVARRVGEFRFTTCATPQFLAEHGTPSTPQDLYALPTIGLSSSRAGRPLPFRFVNGDENLELSLAHRLVVNDTNAYLAAGTSGLGIIQAPTYGVHAALGDGSLVTLFDEWTVASIPVNVIYPPNRYLSAKVRVFIDWVVALFERHEYLRRPRPVR
ncbi:transcriptional regulator, LysR family [Variovorax sp. HW608]|uniref:LysR substrate-binding domain-containing protein n=1 Tax=Variovorax sp. HW608 TaxID=1034889 RepID=UPI00081FB888|nr:LysR family transcriptional regulator [Variovorax sp. HW608]SCK31970.1 transcriptional regulator, LysR family [Variovorax sp. HW608]